VQKRETVEHLVLHIVTYDQEANQFGPCEHGTQRNYVRGGIHIDG